MLVDHLNVGDMKWASYVGLSLLLFDYYTAYWKFATILSTGIALNSYFSII